KVHGGTTLVTHQLDVTCAEDPGISLRRADNGRGQSPDRPGTSRLYDIRKPHCLGHFPHRRATAIGDDRSGKGSPFLAVFLVNISDDLVAVLMLEIDVDVRRLVALGRNETLEEAVHAQRIDLGDAETET